MTARPTGRRGGRTALLATVLLLLSGCGGLVDGAEEQARTSPADVAASDSGTIGPDATLDELLDELLDRWRGLDQRVVDGAGAAPLAAIEEVWAALEPMLRADHQGALFGFEQAVDLARSAAERTRPADATKGYRLLLDLTAELRST